MGGKYAIMLAGREVNCENIVVSDGRTTATTEDVHRKNRKTLPTPAALQNYFFALKFLPVNT